MTTYLVAVHLLVDTNGSNPRAVIVAAPEAQFDRPAAPFPTAVTILDWAVAGEDLSASMGLAIIPYDYTPGTTRFPQWPATRRRMAAP